MSELTEQWYRYEPNPISGKYDVWNKIGDHVGIYDTEQEAKNAVYEKSWDYERRYRLEKGNRITEQDRLDRLERAVLLITDRLELYRTTRYDTFCLGCGNWIASQDFDSLKHADDCPVAEIEAFRKAVETE